MKRITLEELRKQSRAENYRELCSWVVKEVDEGRLKPVKTSGLNGKKPALYCAYWVVKAKEDYSKLEEELKYALHPLIANDYYLKHPEIYQQDRQQVLLLSQFLTEQKERLNHLKSMNERSFEIWGQEKFLQRGKGTQILKRCGISPELLHYYETTEPMSYYCHNRGVPQNLLILENKDTFYSMRKHLLEGNEKILGTPFGTLIYGAGKGIYKSILDFGICAEPYMKDSGNRILYYGDLDYEGIGIYEKLAEQFEGVILPFCDAYIAMLEKAVQRGGSSYLDFLPETSENQNQNISQKFFDCFPEKWTKRMREILEAGKYIPQEILSQQDFTNAGVQANDAV